MKTELFEQIFKESSANTFVNSFVSRFNKTSPQNWDQLVQFTKVNLGSAVGAGTEGLKNDLPMFYQSFSTDDIQQIIAACAVRSNNPNNVLVFFNKFKNALGLTFNQETIIEIIKKALETGESLSKQKV